jgi:rod shape-determining protein MreC
MPSFLSKRKNLVILISLILFQMILISVQVPLGERETMLERTVFSVFAPVQHGILSFFRGIGNFWNNYFGLRDARKNNRRLNEENFILRQQNILLKRSLLQYQDEEYLKEMYRTLSERVVGARVIGMDTENRYKSVLINRGDADGVALNSIVMDAKGNLVGRVIRITCKQAFVQLITDEKSGVSVTTPEGGGLSILKGKGEGLCFLDYSLTTDAAPVEGETLVTTGFDHIYPPGLRVGIVHSVDRQPALFKNVEVKPFFRMEDLDRLAVITISPSDLID